MIEAWPVIIFLLLWVGVTKVKNANLERRLRLKESEEPALMRASPSASESQVSWHDDRTFLAAHDLRLQRDRHVELRNRALSPIEICRHNKMIADLTAQLRSMQ